MIFFQRFLVTKRNDGWPYEHIRKFCKKPDSFPRFWSQRIEKFVTKRKSKSSLRCPCFSFGRCAHRPRCNRHIAVTILANASKPRFKGSYSDGIRDNGRKKSEWRSTRFAVFTETVLCEPVSWSKISTQLSHNSLSYGLSFGADNRVVGGDRCWT